MKPEKFWDFLSARYDNGEDDPSRREDLGLIKAHLHSTDVVLEFACGTGTLSIEIARHVKEVRAIDLSSKMVTIAKKKLADHPVENLHFTQATLFDEKLDNQQFDVVMAFNILHLLEDVPQVLQRIHQLLKPDGIFISSTPCLREEMPFPKNILSSVVFLSGKLGIIPPVSIFTIPELNHLIMDANFHFIETDIFHDEAPNQFIIAGKMEKKS